MTHSLAFRAIIGLVSMLTAAASAQTAAVDYSGQEVMNGYRLKTFGSFTEKWHLVTVRYRKDNEEQRFVYANPSAWKALRDEKKTGADRYPDGAVFAKIGFKTSDDPAFASSVVPDKVFRYQFMIRDRKKFAETDGWGYALFDGGGKTFPEEPHATTISCHACHRVVADRQFVFSQPFQLTPYPIPHRAPEPALIFKTIAARSLPKAVRDELPPKTTDVRSVTGAVTRESFSGTVDEMRPTLIKETLRSKLPALFLSDSGKQFSVSFADGEDKSVCPAGSSGIPLKIVFTAAVNGGTGPETIKRDSHCANP